ncbi:MAG: AarF/ABC1/UbiB kinase family protein [Vicingaceae bacterium]
MESIDSIPTSKIRRAGKIVSTGAKVGLNYAKFYKDRLLIPEDEARERLNENNADDIYDTLKNLKGSALKVAQMLSMDKNVLPRAYVDKFSLSQFSVPPLSPALVVKTFRNYFGKSPNELYDTFSSEAVNAASIGQVHKATLNGKDLAVKIQYPGVAKSVSSDLALIKPVAMRMLNIKGKDSEQYFQEVHDKLMEETDYLLELEQSRKIADACSHLDNIHFPNYYPEYSSDRVITMDWLEGMHLSEFTKNNQDQPLADELGQALWDFYMYQIHVLRMVQADPHPGNFLVSENRKLQALDFGCIKHIPDDFYSHYFELASDDVLNDEHRLVGLLYKLEIIKENDSRKEREFFTEMFRNLLSLFIRPLKGDSFDFTDRTFFDEIKTLGETLSSSAELKKLNGNRGSKHFIYMNRTFFGLYHLMFDLKARNVEINRFAGKKEAKLRA